MKTSQSGINLIKQFEGCRLEAYKPVAAEKYFTIGYGHYGPDVKQGMVISQALADAYLKADLEKYERYVENTGLSLNQNQFDALVSFAYNCGAGNLNKLVKGRTIPEIADAILLYNKGSGKVLKGLVRRRNAERELLLKGVNEMTVIIGSARISENGSVTGGKVGDQKQTTTPDYTGEVSLQKFYEHKKGWLIIRHNNPDVSKKLAEAMERACNNPNIGYDQSGRYKILKKGTSTETPTECDCSSLVRQCVIETTGKDPGDFTTGNEAAVLSKAGFIRIDYHSKSELKTGDILVTKSKGHTVIVTSVSEETNPYREPAALIKEGMTGVAVKWIQYQLNKHGYNLKIDGIYGNKTKAAVLDLQKKHNVEVDGIVGPQTKAILKSED